MYMPMMATCTSLISFTSTDLGIDQVYGIRFRTRATDMDAQIGTIYAVSAETGETGWRMEQRAGTLSLLATRTARTATVSTMAFGGIRAG